jgi:hypothetical protein
MVGLITDTTFERHLSIAELSFQWKINRETIRLLVKDEPGVARVRKGLMKLRTLYSVPESVARRIHNRLIDSLAA